jgi:hypothetical protein
MVESDELRAPETVAEADKRLTLESFDTLFNCRDYETAVRFWPPQYIRHGTYTPPGHERPFDPIRAARPPHCVISPDSWSRMPTASWCAAASPGPTGHAF